MRTLPRLVALTAAIVLTTLALVWSPAVSTAPAPAASAAEFATLPHGVDPVDHVASPTRATPTVRDSLPITGASSYGPLAVGGVMLLLGLVGLLIKNNQHGSRRNR